MEKICDLLDGKWRHYMFIHVLNFLVPYIAKKTNLQVKDDKTRGLYVADATEVYV